jgi:two-component system, NarL family, response regulator NreC
LPCQSVIILSLTVGTTLREIALKNRQPLAVHAGASLDPNRECTNRNGLERSVEASGRRVAPKTVRVVIAGGQPIWRAGVEYTLARIRRTRYEIAGEADDAEAMLTAVHREHPDLLILDVMMHGRPALQELALCLAMQPALTAVVLTACADPELVRDAISLGTRGWLTADASPSDLALALVLILRGGSYLGPGVASRLAEEPPQVRLTPRQREVVRLRALGYTHGQIASQLSLSERTIKSDLARAAAALGVSSREQLTRWALNHGLLA